MMNEKVEQIKHKKLSAEDNIKGFIDKIGKENEKLNIVLHINPNAIDQAKFVDEKIKKGERVGKLAGLGFLVKSNINVLGLIANCASKTLTNYKATYNATVIEKLLHEDAIVLGMANMDEFACGASGESSAFGVCKNPVALDRVPGGSSSGSAAGVAAKFCDFALGSDTGGSIRNPSSHCGVVGMKPSYGQVSRYGLIDLSMSLDQIGPVGKRVEDVELIYSVIRGWDKNDSSSIDYKIENKSVSKIKIGVVDINADGEIKDLIDKKINEVVEQENWIKKNIKIKHIDLGIQTYYPIAYVEFFSGTRRFDGRKYGFEIDKVGGEEVLRRILGGKEISKAEYAGKYYRKAMTAKKIIEKEFVNAFKDVDVIIMPTVPRLPHKLSEKISLDDMYNYDVLTVLANLAEIPAISVPCSEINEIPVGIQLLCAKGKDNLMLDIAKKFE